jgi:hypothetical protein
MFVEPLANAVVNVPGVMEMLAAPVAAQFNALLAPTFMLDGVAVNEVIVGAELLPVPDPEDDLDVVPAVQLINPTQTNKVRANTEPCSPKWLRTETQSFVPQYLLGIAICSRFAGDGYKSLMGGV